MHTRAYRDSLVGAFVGVGGYCRRAWCIWDGACTSYMHETRVWNTRTRGGELSSIFFFESARKNGKRAQCGCHEITPMVSMAAESTDTERAQTSASHRHHHTHRATPIVTICAARRDSTRAKRSNKLKIHAATRKTSTLSCDRHCSSSHSPAQARTRAIALVSGRSAGFHFDHYLAGTHTHTHEASARTKPQCAPQMHIEERWRSAATRRPCGTSALPAD